jgi:hypothetical protein
VCEKDVKNYFKYSVFLLYGISEHHPIITLMLSVEQVQVSSLMISKLREEPPLCSE